MIKKEIFGTMPSGETVYAYSLVNCLGASVKIMTLGATLISINVPNAEGTLADVICGYDDVDSYLNSSGYQGAIIGRFGNRINNSSFVLDGVEYKLYNNEGNNHLHGGKEGFDKKIWQAKHWEIGDVLNLELTYRSQDMEEGYPGNLLVKILYSFDQNNTLTINYKAVTDKKTVVNLTNHAYFNLGGYASGAISRSHSLWVDADKITEVNENLIPTGREIPVEGTVFDLRTEQSLHERLRANSDKQFIIGQGYDHNFVLNNNGELKHVATLSDNESGRKMKVFTNQPCIQIYSANCINENDPPFKLNISQKRRCAICLETQHAPDTPNRPEFGSCVLNPGDMYDYTTIFKFEN